jgi:hypothetical protein
MAGGTDDHCARRIAEFLGLDVICVGSFVEAVGIVQSANGASYERIGFMMSASSLNSMCREMNAENSEHIKCLRKMGDWFLYGVGNNSTSDKNCFAYFTELPVPVATQETNSARSYVFEGSGEANFPLTGLKLRCEESDPSYVFSPETVSADFSTLISLNARPLLISRPNGSYVDYLLSEPPKIDLDAVFSPPRVTRDYLSGILPVAVVLREIFAEFCWHNPFPSGSVVIDDPLIRRQYGAFNYDDMDRELLAHNYSATIAFIPCNFNRSDQPLASELSDHAKRWSICVHGCYHTKAEFGESDSATIENTANTALRFMECHKRVTGLSFDNVMVFPQGIFSSTAIGALKKFRYTAAVNSDPYPNDCQNAPVTIGDVFDLAILRYSLFPIFTRRYPDELFEFAVDLFFGKPAIIVEHHEYFRNGGAARLSRFVKDVNGLGLRIAWEPLEKAVIGSGKYRSVGKNRYAVMFVTDTFRLGNPRKDKCSFTCRKPETAHGDILSVTVDNKPWDFKYGGDGLSVEVSLDGNESRIIRIERKPASVSIKPMPLKFIIRAKLRRRLSEFRDDHVRANSILARSIRKVLKMVGK